MILFFFFVRVLLGVRVEALVAVDFFLPEAVFLWTVFFAGADFLAAGASEEESWAEAGTGKNGKRMPNVMRSEASAERGEFTTRISVSPKAKKVYRRKFLPIRVGSSTARLRTTSWEK